MSYIINPFTGLPDFNGVSGPLVLNMQTGFVGASFKTQLNGVDKFSINQNGNVMIDGATSFTVPMLSLNHPSVGFAAAGNRIDVILQGGQQVSTFGQSNVNFYQPVLCNAYGFSTSTVPSNQSTLLTSLASGEMLQRSGNGLVEQAFLVSGVLVDADNYQRAAIRHGIDGSTGERFVSLAAEGDGTGFENTDVWVRPLRNGYVRFGDFVSDGSIPSLDGYITIRLNDGSQFQVFGKQV